MSFGGNLGELEVWGLSVGCGVGIVCGQREVCGSKYIRAGRCKLRQFVETLGSVLKEIAADSFLLRSEMWTAGPTVTRELLEILVQTEHDEGVVSCVSISCRYFLILEPTRAALTTLFHKKDFFQCLVETNAWCLIRSALKSPREYQSDHEIQI